MLCEKGVYLSDVEELLFERELVEHGICLVDGVEEVFALGLQSREGLAHIIIKICSTGI